MFIKEIVLYNTMETTQLIGPKCNSKEIIKRGLIKTDNRESTQRYGCKKCHNRFVLDTPYFRMRNKEQIITQTMDMYYSGMSFRKIADHLVRFFPKGVHYSTIYRGIIKYVPIMENFTEQQGIKVGFMLQGDEVEYKRRASAKQKGVREEFFIDIIDTDRRYIVASDYAKDRMTNTLNKVYRNAKRKVGDQVKVISTDGLVGYPRVIKKTFGYNPHATRNPKVIHQVIKSDSGGFNYKVERFHNTLRERTKVMRGFHGCITSAQTLLKGFEIYYNWIRNHQGIEGLTPSELACPQVSIQDKNKWLELINRGYNGK